MSEREFFTPERRRVVVVFDIVDNRRRRRFIKMVSRYGLRTQFSVFECWVADRQRERFIQKLRAAIDCDEDRLTLYPLCGNCRTAIHWEGTPLAQLTDPDASGAHYILT